MYCRHSTAIIIFLICIY